MTEPIPEDLMKVAEEAFDLMLCECTESCGGTDGLRRESIATLARALATERERCAAIAQDFIAPMAGLGQAAAANAAMNIAKAILARP